MMLQADLRKWRGGKAAASFQKRGDGAQENVGKHKTMYEHIRNNATPLEENVASFVVLMSFCNML